MRFDGAAQLIGVSPPISDLREEIDRVARTDAKVLITGESGTGKEVVARQVYALSNRSSRSFVPVNCAGLPETLLESELFGHVRGSFTGAYRDKPGKLEVADEGTIFLDEIGEMTLRMQGLLLRFLETGEIQKVGADRTGNRVDVRTIAATNRNLREMIAQGLFREDLFYRLNVIHLDRSAAARPEGRCPGAGRTLSRPDGAAGREHAAADRTRGDDDDARVSLAGQRPRAAERDRTDGGSCPHRCDWGR